MLPGQIDSDDDVETASHAELSGRWSLLIDLQREFGGAFGAYLIFAILWPGGLVAYTVFGSPDNPTRILFGAALIFIVCLTISLYTLWWYVWAKRREAKTFELMQRRGEEELAREEQGKVQRRAAGQDLFG
jgi:hypothetical protein